MNNRLFLSAALIWLLPSWASAQARFHTDPATNAVVSNASGREKSGTKKKYADEKNKIDEKTLQFWKDTLAYGTAGQKKSVISYIDSRHLKIGEPLVIKAYPEETDIEIRKLMISSLVSFSNQAVIPDLMAFLSATNTDDNKIFGLEKIGSIGYHPAASAILPLVDAESILVAEAALRALTDIRASETAEALIKKYQDTREPRLRTKLILALAELHAEQAQDILAAILENDEEDEINRSYAATGLGYIANARSYEILRKYYPGSPPTLKMRIISALTELGNPGARDILLDGIKNDNFNIRIFSIRGLARLKIRDARDILKYKIDYDPETKVRAEAKKALKELTGEE